MGLLTNPEIEIEAENFLGSGLQREFEQTETTVSISQLFELGGKLDINILTEVHIFNNHC